MVELVISVVCYSNEDEVLNYAKNISMQEEAEKIVLLITCNKCDNIDKFMLELSKINIKYRVFNPRDNLGYINACLYGFKNFNEEYNWGIICNTDLEFLEKNFFYILLKKEYASTISCIAPEIILKTNKVNQNPFLIRRPSKIGISLKKLIYSNYITLYIYRRIYRLKRKLIGSNKRNVPARIIYAPHGSMVILRKKSIDEMLVDNIKIFMYGEEIYIAEKLRECGHKCYYDKDLKIIHNENQTTSKIKDKRKQEWHKESISFLKDRYFN